MNATPKQKTHETPAAQPGATHATEQVSVDVPGSIAGATPNAAPLVLSRSVVPLRYKKQYAPNHGSNGDQIASALFHACRTQDGKTDLVKLRAIAQANGVDHAKYAGLNPGMQRMNIGNRLRGMAQRGEAIEI
jgi:hypothetical protein